MVESEGRNHKEQLRFGNEQLVNRIRELLFTPKTVNDIAIMDPNALSLLIADAEHTETHDRLSVRYFPDRTVEHDHLPVNFAFPTYLFSVNHNDKTSQIISIASGFLPGEFIDSNNRHIVIQEGYVINSQGEGVVQMEFHNRSSSDETYEPDPETISRRARLPRIAVDLNIDRLHVDIYQLDENDQNYINAVLSQYENGEFTQRIYFRRTRELDRKFEDN